MSKLGKALVVMASVAAVALPAAPALANPCKGSAPGPHCRPPCTFTPRVDPGDPANGIGPTVWIEEGGC
jgi:hypothetical protein